MNKSKIMVILSLSIICYFISKYYHNSEINGFFKHSSGYSIGDYFEIPSNLHHFRGDTIFRQNQPLAKLTNYERRIDGSGIIQIRSISNDEIGFYIKK